MKKVFAALLLVVVTCSLASAAEIGFTGNVGGGHHTGDWHDAETGSFIPIRPGVFRVLAITQASIEVGAVRLPR